MIQIEKVDASAIPLIRRMALDVWPLTYQDILTTEQVEYMMELIYSTSSLQKQIDKGHQFIIAYDETIPVAFASYSVRENDATIVKLQKIYILPNQQGKGLGKLLVDYVKHDIQPLTTLELNVNRHNKALSFYEKMGFKIIREEDIDIGNGFLMNDYVMQMKTT